MKIQAIVTCAGKGTRAGFKENKILKKIDGITVFEKTLSVFLDNENVSSVIVTASEKDMPEFKKLIKPTDKEISFVLGGETRTLSVYNALKKANADIVLIHDGARPFVSSETINRCISTVKEFRSAIACIAPTDTIARSLDGQTIEKSGRDGYYNVQTPQGFYLDDILPAYEKAIKSEKSYTDDGSIYSEFVKPAHIFIGNEENVKLTYKKDFSNGFLVGTGFDLHKLVPNRKLILGGIEIPHEKGLLGHSDADVLTHAVMDSLLSALSLGDIGKHFPDNDVAYKDISSIVLLKKVLELLKKEGWKVHNVSAVIMAEKPKLAPFTQKISTFLSEVIHIDEKMIGITCTTLEGVGLIGREEAIACQAYCSLEKI